MAAQGLETSTRTFSSYLAGYAPWKHISSLLTLASTQLGNTFRIENTVSTSWKPRDDDDERLQGPMFYA